MNKKTKPELEAELEAMREAMEHVCHEVFRLGSQSRKPTKEDMRQLYKYIKKDALGHQFY